MASESFPVTTHLVDNGVEMRIRGLGSTEMLIGGILKTHVTGSPVQPPGILHESQMHNDFALLMPQSQRAEGRRKEKGERSFNYYYLSLVPISLTCLFLLLSD
jgi:hypothetical protein